MIWWSLQRLEYNCTHARTSTRASHGSNQQN